MRSSQSSLLLLNMLFFFFPLPKYIIPEVLPLSGISLALASGMSLLDPAALGSVGRGGIIWQLLRAPVLPRPCHTHPHCPHQTNLACATGKDQSSHGQGDPGCVSKSHQQFTSATSLREFSACHGSAGVLLSFPSLGC